MKAFLLAMIIIISGCGRAVCPERYNPGKPIYVAVDTNISPEHLLKGFAFWEPLGYQYHIHHQGDPEPTLIIGPLIDDRNKTIIGLAFINTGYVLLGADADWRVVAHELGHMNGITNHIDEHKYPIGCHIMNSKICDPMVELTPEDIELFNKRGSSCNN